LKLGCSSWSFHVAFRSGRIDQRAWLRLCAEEMELDGVELVDLHFPTTDPVYLRDIKKLCTDLQLTIGGVAVSNDFGAEDRRSLEAAKVKQWCDVAAYLGAPVVRVFAGWVPSDRATERPGPGRIVGAFRRVFGAPRVDQRRLWSDVTATLRLCADYAAERGVVLALQNNRSDGIVGAAAQLAQCVHDVGSPWLRICLDPADFGGGPAIDSIMPGIVQVHARMRDVREDGSDAQIHWPGMLQALKLGRYRGFVMLDYEGIEDPATAVPRAATYMRGVLHLLQRRQLLTQTTAGPEAGSESAAPAIHTTSPAFPPQAESAAREASISG
jgi:L-ribulose-5-phosphate 3-epimerase